MPTNVELHWVGFSVKQSASQQSASSQPAVDPQFTGNRSSSATFRPCPSFTRSSLASHTAGPLARPFPLTLANCTAHLDLNFRRSIIKAQNMLAASTAVDCMHCQRRHCAERCMKAAGKQPSERVRGSATGMQITFKHKHTYIHTCIHIYRRTHWVHRLAVNCWMALRLARRGRQFYICFLPFFIASCGLGLLNANNNGVSICAFHNGGDYHCWHTFAHTRLAMNPFIVWRQLDFGEGAIAPAIAAPLLKLTLRSGK